MNASPTTRTISARWLHSSIVIGSTLLIVAAIAIVLTFRSLSGATPAARSIPALDSYAPLDQHERRSELLTKYGAALDQHERHPDLFAPKAEHAALPDALDRYLAAHNRP